MKLSDYIFNLPITDIDLYVYKDVDFDIQFGNNIVKCSKIYISKESKSNVYLECIYENLYVQIFLQDIESHSNVTIKQFLDGLKVNKILIPFKVHYYSEEVSVTTSIYKVGKLKMNDWSSSETGIIIGDSAYSYLVRDIINNKSISKLENFANKSFSDYCKKIIPQIKIIDNDIYIGDYKKYKNDRITSSYLTKFYLNPKYPCLEFRLNYSYSLFEYTKNINSIIEATLKKEFIQNKKWKVDISNKSFYDDITNIVNNTIKDYLRNLKILN